MTKDLFGFYELVCQQAQIFQQYLECQEYVMLIYFIKHKLSVELLHTKNEWMHELFLTHQQLWSSQQENPLIDITLSSS